MIKSDIKSKKVQTVVVQQQSGQVKAPQPILELPKSKPSGMVTPSHEEIAMRAYQIYIERGSPQGQSEQIWQQAEKEVSNRTKGTVKST